MRHAGHAHRSSQCCCASTARAAPAAASAAQRLRFLLQRSARPPLRQHVAPTPRTATLPGAGPPGTAAQAPPPPFALQWGQMPLLWAAYQGHLEVAELLVENGADLMATDKAGHCCVHSRPPLHSQTVPAAQAFTFHPLQAARTAAPDATQAPAPNAYLSESDKRPALRRTGHVRTHTSTARCLAGRESVAALGSVPGPH